MNNYQNGGLFVRLLFAIALVAAFFLFCIYFFGQNQQSTESPAGEGAKETEVESEVESEVEAESETESGNGDSGMGNAPNDDAGEPGTELLTDSDGDIFSFIPVGEIIPGSGPGFVDNFIYRNNIIFPTEEKVFLNSQKYRHGGQFGIAFGFDGGRCHTENFEYPWQDTFCEKRDRNQSLCPGGGHEGLDIRPVTCTKDVHWAVAVADGRIADIRRHWVTLNSSDGAIYNYLHLNMSRLSVNVGDQVSQGDRIGLISNDFFRSNGNRVFTTVHLHFEMYDNYVGAEGDPPLFTKVNPYMTLVNAYEKKLRNAP